MLNLNYYAAFDHTANFFSTMTVPLLVNIIWQQQTVFLTVHWNCNVIIWWKFQIKTGLQVAREMLEAGTRRSKTCVYQLIIPYFYFTDLVMIFADGDNMYTLYLLKKLICIMKVQWIRFKKNEIIGMNFRAPAASFSQETLSSVISRLYHTRGL